MGKRLRFGVFTNTEALVVYVFGLITYIEALFLSVNWRLRP